MHFDGQKPLREITATCVPAHGIKLNECFAVGDTLETSSGRALLQNATIYKKKDRTRNWYTVKPIGLAHGPSTHLQLAPDSRLAARERGVCAHRGQKQNRQIKECV